MNDSEEIGYITLRIPVMKSYDAGTYFDLPEGYYLTTGIPETVESKFDSEDFEFIEYELSLGDMFADLDHHVADEIRKAVS